MAVEPDGRDAGGGRRRQLDPGLILDADTLEVRHACRSEVDDRVWALSFSPDGRLLAGRRGDRQSARRRHQDVGGRRAGPPCTRRRLLQFEWLRDGRTVVSPGSTARSRCSTRERGVVRTEPLPASVDGEAGYATCPRSAPTRLVVLNDQRVGPALPDRPVGLAPGGVRDRRA